MGLLKHMLKSNCMKPVMDDHTRSVYERGINKYEQWVKDQGISQRNAMHEKNSISMIQSYADYLVEKGYTAASVHTYLAPICKGYKVNMALIDKPPRLASDTTKGRLDDKNQRGKKDSISDKNHILIEWASVCGLRRTDYIRLTGSSIHYGEDGFPKYITCKSKGGKHVKQFILPFKQEKALKLLDQIAKQKGLSSHSEIKKDEKLFTTSEIKRCYADLHEYRRQNAREAYDYYASIEDPKTIFQLQQFLVKLYAEEKKGVTETQVKKFEQELKRGDYCLRGANAEKARKEGKPQRYNRTAIMLVSLAHLAHFRADVTISSYLAN